MTAFRVLASRAWRDIQQGDNILSTYPREFVLEYFDAAVGLATAFLFVELGWKRIYAVEEWEPLLIAVLCFFHVIVYWINVHHCIKYTVADELTVVQVWLTAAVSLGLIIYPMSLNAWLDGEQNVLYYVVNIWMCVSLTLLTRSMEISDRANDLYRFYHLVAAPLACVWYSLALILAKGGFRVEWMIYVAPFLYMCPLGGERKQKSD